jgi:hypothetical protein
MKWQVSGARPAIPRSSRIRTRDSSQDEDRNEEETMAVKVRRVQYFHVAVKDEPGAAYRILSELAGAKVNLLAFNAIPTGPENTQLTLFPENPDELAGVADSQALCMVGPHHAFLVQADDRLGSLAELHRTLFDSRINVYASSGVSDGGGHFGYVLFVRSQDYEAAAHALGV